MVGKDDSFTSRVFCIHKTFKNIKLKLEIFSEVMSFVPQGDDSFYQKLESDIKVILFLHFTSPLAIKSPFCV